MIEKRTWKEFRESGLLWWVNRTLHLFGWAIVFEFNDDNDVDEIAVYPAKSKFRGFDEDTDNKGFINLTNHVKENIDELIDVVVKIDGDKTNNI